MDKIIERASDLKRKDVEQLSIDEIISYLDDVVNELVKTLNGDKEVIVSNEGFRISGAVAKMIRTKYPDYLSQSSALIEHKYIQLVRNTIIFYFDQLNRNCLSLTDTDNESLSDMCLMVTEMCNKLDKKNSKLIQQLFITKEFIQPMQQIMDDISAKGEHLSNGNILISLYNFIQFFTKYIQLTNDDDPNLLSLVQAAIKCLCSEYYLNIFKGMAPQCSISNPKEHLFLIECPLLVTNYINKQRDHLFDDNSYHQVFLSNTNEILKEVLPNLHKYKIGHYKAIKHLLEILLMIPNDYYYDNKTTIIGHFTTILQSTDKPLDDSNLDQQRTDLIKLTISLIHQFASDSKLLEAIQNNQQLCNLLKTELFTSKTVHVQFATEMLLCLLDEKHVKDLPNPQDTAKTFVTYLKISVKDPVQQCEGVQLKNLQTTLKGNVSVNEYFYKFGLV
ncbi:unnamed protein product [Didymodactylos carnosus]|uniref:Uncharacterized protein n=1 Tax=Didymodactylos carnosus TaxID=1234261 RepID=A0A8S2I5P2_9BILA|nr:unnamed protein product [Didymodactylos carnosus]CAF3711462.1 unnamed protein product [Didymodactylos carnosus]